MKKVILLLTVLVFNVSNAQESYKFKDKYKLLMAYGFFQKGSVTYKDEVLTVSFKNRKMGNDLVYNLKDYRANSLVKEINSEDLYSLSMLDNSRLVRHTIAFTKEGFGIFSITSKDAFTGEFNSIVISFK